MKLLQEIEKERADIKERQTELVKKKAKLDELIERAKSNIVDNSPAVRVELGYTMFINDNIDHRKEIRKKRKKKSADIKTSILWTA